MIRKASFSRRAVAWLSVLLLLVSLLPMYALALYNHAFYDDLGFSLLTRKAWVASGSPWAVLEAAVRNTVGIRQTWEGTYTTSFVSTLQPAVFGEGAYWVTTFLLLTVFLLAVWYFLHVTLRGVYGMDRAATWAAFGILGFVLTQFVPDAAEAYYWYNGGVAYTLLWSVMLFSAGGWVRFENARGRLRCTLQFALLAVLMILVGGAKYSTVLFALLLAVCFTAWAWLRKRPKRFAYLALTALLAAGFAVSVSAQGNAVRAQTLAGNIGAPKAVLEAVYFGLALVGHSFSLPLVAALALLVPLSLPAIRQSTLHFAHPLWVTAFSAALFCAQLAPTLYTGNYLGDGRVLNTYYYTLVMMLTQLVLYWTGFVVRRSERGLSPLAVCSQTEAETPAAVPARDGETSDTDALPHNGETGLAAPALAHSGAVAPAGEGGSAKALEQRLKAATLLLVAGMLLWGCVAYHPDWAESYGPQNMAGGSALRAIVSGQAAAFDTAMDARDALLNDPTLNDVALVPVTGAPQSFMGDALLSDNLAYVLTLYADYYDKATVTVDGQGEGYAVGR